LLWQEQAGLHNTEIVIKKGGGNRPCEALATLYSVKKVLLSTGPLPGKITMIHPTLSG
jgi:hypothetical protein